MSLAWPLPLLTEHTRLTPYRDALQTQERDAFQTQDRNALQKQVTGGGVVLYQTTNTLYQSDILNILCDQDESRISDIPPMKPCANELYLIRRKFKTPQIKEWVKELEETRAQYHEKDTEGT